MPMDTVILEQLFKRLSSRQIQPFLDALARFRNCSIDRHAVFEAMEKTIQSARRLLGQQQPTMMSVERQMPLD